MRYDELIGQVQAGAELPDRGSATRAVRAVLATLAERLPDGTARHLFAQLPADLVALVEGPEPPESAGTPGGGAAAERFDLPTFSGRVAWRGGVSEDVAVRYVSAVFEVLDAAVSPDLMKKVADALPRDIGRLLPAARVGDSPE
ncbi:DUF2267 domain-containing protein [Streptomyces montanisoli]|uniref:DUF2267 domain-containing protein n=1 Tax=Streptomyces montanisoli TaxID=2798581 RepID=A0A940MFY5_9ACTN|nr:DUF2267 domain-containing protein [Streptomyces montanisoli]MBP0458476.1 DUF2267 domain-containing protein [Streptomyces montanisoli]